MWRSNWLSRQAEIAEIRPAPRWMRDRTRAGCRIRPAPQRTISTGQGSRGVWRESSTALSSASGGGHAGIRHLSWNGLGGSEALTCPTTRDNATLPRNRLSAKALHDRDSHNRSPGNGPCSGLRRPLPRRGRHGHLADFRAFRPAPMWAPSPAPSGASLCACPSSMPGCGSRRPAPADTPEGRRFPRPISPAGLVFAGDLFFWHLSILNTTVANATFFATTAPLFVVLIVWLV